jgi:hypothetical protein
MSTTLHLTDAEAALVLRLLDAELTMPQLVVHQAMNPHEDLEQYRELVQHLIDRFHATAR